MKINKNVLKLILSLVVFSINIIKSQNGLSAENNNNKTFENRAEFERRRAIGQFAGSGQNQIQQEVIDNIMNKANKYIESLEKLNRLFKKHNGDLQKIKNDQEFLNIKPALAELVYTLRFTLPLILPLINSQLGQVRSAIKANIDTQFGQYEILNGLKGSFIDLSNGLMNFVEKDVVIFLNKLSEYASKDKSIKFLIED